MSRVACLFVPHLLVQAQVRAEPELAGQGVLVVEKLAGASCKSPRVLDAASVAPLVRLPYIGMSEVQAQARNPELVVRVRNDSLRRSALAALVDVARAFASEIEPGQDEVWCEVSALGRLYDNEEQMASAIGMAARKLRLEILVGIAQDKVTSRIAARADRGVIPAGREAAFLAPLPLALLDPSPEVAQTLSRWGIRRIGELESLPSDGVAVRLGQEGARLSRIARGALLEALVPLGEAPVFMEETELEWPVDNLEALGFILRPLLENLLARLGSLHLSSGTLRLGLHLDGQGWDERVVEVAAPTKEAMTLLQLIRVHLETHPAQNAILGVRVSAQPEGARPLQLGLFAAAGPSPEKLAATLARLQALVGRDRVGAPQLVDTHLPDAFTVGAFAGAPKEEVNGMRILALHAFRPPRKAEVVCGRIPNGEIGLRFVQAEGVGRQVLHSVGPFRLRQHDFGAPLLRDYYDVELSDGGIYRMVHDLLVDQWFVDGCYE